MNEDQISSESNDYPDSLRVSASSSRRPHVVLRRPARVRLASERSVPRTAIFRASRYLGCLGRTTRVAVVATTRRARASQLSKHLFRLVLTGRAILASKRTRPTGGLSCYPPRHPTFQLCSVPALYRGCSCLRVTHRNHPVTATPNPYVRGQDGSWVN